MKNLRWFFIALCVLGIAWWSTDASGEAQGGEAVREKEQKKSIVIIGLPDEQAAGFIQALSKTDAWDHHFRRAEALVLQKRYEEAAEEYKEAIKASGDGGLQRIARLGLVDVYEATGQYRLAADELTFLVEHQTADWAKPPLIERLLALKAAEAGDFEKAVEHARMALELYLNRPAPRDANEVELYRSHLRAFEEKAKAQRGP
jgi:tetratricopeptide (TPR) repeat protein